MCDISKTGLIGSVNYIGVQITENVYFCTLQFVWMLPLSVSVWLFLAISTKGLIKLLKWTKYCGSFLVAVFWLKNSCMGCLVACDTHKIK